MEILIKSLKDCCMFIMLGVGLIAISVGLIVLNKYVYEALMSLDMLEELAVIISLITSVFVICVLGNLKAKYFDNK